jgi:cobalt-zinc-cadmium efflux system membrane fusion protein
MSNRIFAVLKSKFLKILIISLMSGIGWITPDQMKLSASIPPHQPPNHPPHISLTARVVVSPYGYAQAHARQISRMVVDPAYPIPELGERVKVGQVIAVIDPLLSYADLMDKEKELYRLKGEIAKFERGITRLEILGKLHAHKELDDAKLNLASAKKQEQVFLKGLGKEFVCSPINGVISQIIAFQGRIIKPEDLIAEIIDPASLRVEAYTQDHTLDNNIHSALLSLPTQSETLYPLKFIGASSTVRETDQARQILFSLTGPVPHLLIGMHVKVIIKRKVPL